MTKLYNRLQTIKALSTQSFPRKCAENSWSVYISKCCT